MFNDGGKRFPRQVFVESKNPIKDTAVLHCRLVPVLLLDINVYRSCCCHQWATTNQRIGWIEHPKISNVFYGEILTDLSAIRVC